MNELLKQFKEKYNLKMASKEAVFEIFKKYLLSKGYYDINLNNSPFRNGFCSCWHTEPNFILVEFNSKNEVIKMMMKKPYKYTITYY